VGASGLSPTPHLALAQAVHFAQHHAHRLPAGQKLAPTFIGLCCIPLLPYLDEPAEVVIDAAFDYCWPGEEPEGIHEEQPWSGHEKKHVWHEPGPATDN